MTFARLPLAGRACPEASRLSQDPVAAVSVQHWLAVSRRGGAGRKTPAPTDRTQSEGTAITTKGSAR